MSLNEVSSIAGADYVRIGLNDNLAKEFFALGLADRVVATEMSGSLPSSEVELVWNYKDIIITHRQIIEPGLRKYPSVFLEAIY
ncbi:hypothetical protein ACSL9C_000269 [Vibrio navarrensis]